MRKCQLVYKLITTSHLGNRGQPARLIQQT